MGKCDKHGQSVRKRGAEMCKKRLFLGGYLAKYGSKKGIFWPKKPGKKAHFCIAEGKLTGEEGISVETKTLCHGAPWPGTTPRRQLEW
jgi:hypothetical protein